MSDKPTSPTLTELRNRILPLIRGLSEEVAVAMLRSVPFVGSALVIDRKTLSRLSALFESDDEIQRDIDKVVQNMSETEEIMNHLKMHVETRKNDLQQTLDDYNRFKELAAVEKKNAEPLLKELRREGNKGVIWGAITNLAMVILGIILAHFLRIWLPGFTF